MFSGEKNTERQLIIYVEEVSSKKLFSPLTAEDDLDIDVLKKQGSVLVTTRIRKSVRKDPAQIFSKWEYVVLLYCDSPNTNPYGTPCDGADVLWRKFLMS